MADKEIKISIRNNEQAAIFFGPGDENFRYLKSICSAEISSRGAEIFIRGEEEEVQFAHNLVKYLIETVESEGQLNIKILPMSAIF